MASQAAKLTAGCTIFLVSDLQTRFRDAIYGFDHVVATTNKMLRVAKLLSIPVAASEQNPARLGKTVDEINFAQLGPLHCKTFSKTRFSLVTPELDEIIKSEEYCHIKSIVLMGIESHICVLQTALDLLEIGYDVHVLADGVSSCNKEEVPFALERMRQANAQITTSESITYQLMRDAGNENFKAFAQIIREESSSTRSALQALSGYMLSPL